MRGTWVCDACARSLPRLETGICYRCGAPAEDICRWCPQLDRAIGHARAVFPYSGWVVAAIRSLKYADERDRAGHLASLMLPMLDAIGPFDAIVPVPLHARRLRDRGYNQAELLASKIGTRIGVPVRPLLIRTRDTASQVTQTREQRLSNVSGAFVLDPRWSPAPNQRLLLVDDVRTTGATLNACAQELLRIGPSQLMAATLALDIPADELAKWLAEHQR